MKSFKDISWDITEPDYRKDPALSYSTLSTFQTVGFGGLDTLFDRKDSPSLKFGSGVDALMTGSQEEFNSLFHVDDFPQVSDNIASIVKQLFDLYKSSYDSLVNIPFTDAIIVVEANGYQPRWKPETRWKDICEKGSRLYDLYYLADNKTLINRETYAKMLEDVNALRNAPSTAYYFQANNPFDGVERFYQLKFKAKLHGIDYRCMADLIVVDHNNKTVYPVDLKTSSGYEYEFPEHFIKWHYQIQARLYWRIIRSIMDNDDFYKEYKLADYKFIVVNNVIGRKPLPMVWEFPYTTSTGAIKLADHTLPDPESLGAELRGYLDTPRDIPVQVTMEANKTNNIVDWLNDRHS